MCLLSYKFGDGRFAKQSSEANHNILTRQCLVVGQSK